MQSTTTQCGVNVVRAEGGMIVPLTSCCNATGKGWDDEVVCRGCYEPVSGLAFGTEGWGAVKEAVSLAGCPCPDACADEALFRLEV